MKLVNRIFVVWVLVAALLHGSNVAAQQYSFIYIQGDKNVPFYVKLEGEMMPRYGKNYCIIPRLEPGEINIDILFQQNAFPEEHFILKVPENGARSFLLTRKDNAYSLYDLQQGVYLAPGNASADDYISEQPPIAASISAAALETGDKPVAETNTNTIEGHTTVEKQANTEAKPIHAKTLGSVFKPAQQPVSTQANDSEPHFLNDIEFNNNQDKGGVISTGKKRDNQTVYQEGAAPLIITNSDCPQPISDNEFLTIYKKEKQQDDEESRLGYLLGEMKRCYSRSQVRQMAALLDSDAGRFTLLKKAYARTTDQGGYLELEDLLTSSQWRQYFRDFVKN